MMSVVDEPYWIHDQLVQFLEQVPLQSAIQTPMISHMHFVGLMGDKFIYTTMQQKSDINYQLAKMDMGAMALPPYEDPKVPIYLLFIYIG